MSNIPSQSRTLVAMSAPIRGLLAVAAAAFSSSNTPVHAAVRACAVACLAVAAGASQAQQVVAVESPAQKGSPAVTLKAYWFPAPAAGEGASAAGPAKPLPAVVLLHGCSGPYDQRGRLAQRYHDYAALLHSVGMHALVVDSFTPRGEKELCTQKIGERRINQSHRRADALAALEWLSRQDGVDAARLGLLGWSHGGSAVLAATHEGHPDVAKASARAAFAVAYYPGCSAELVAGYRSKTRLLMQLGAEDDWTPPQPCERLAQAAGPRVEVVSHPGAYHGFDGAGTVQLRKDVPNGAHPGQGVHVGGDPQARERSRQLLKEFLRSVG